MKEGRRLLPGEKAFGLLVLILSLFLSYHAYDIAGFSSISSAGTFPMVAAAVMVFCSLVVVWRNFRMPRVEADGFRGEMRRFAVEIAPLRPLGIYVGIIVAYMFAIEPLGFSISSLVFLFASFWYLHRKGLVFAAGLSIASVTAIYALFRVVFKVVLPEAEWLDLGPLGLGG